MKGKNKVTKKGTKVTKKYHYITDITTGKRIRVYVCGFCQCSR